MKETLFQARLGNLFKQRNSLLVLNGMLLTSNVLMAASLFFKDTPVVIVPPDFQQEMNVATKTVSVAYVEEMALYFSHLLLDVSQARMAYHRDILLRHVTPDQHGALRAQLLDDEARYQKQDLSTSFNPTSVAVDTHKNQVHLKGQLISFVGREKATEQLESFVLTYVYEKGRFWLVSFIAEEAKS